MNQVQTHGLTLSHCKPLWSPQISESQCPNHGALTLAEGAQVKPFDFPTQSKKDGQCSRALAANIMLIS